MKRTVKPRTHFVLDIALFSLFTILLVAIILQLVFAHDERQPGHIALGYIHGIAGVLMAALAGIHLYWHFPWIDAQLKAALRRYLDTERPAPPGGRGKDT